MPDPDISNKDDESNATTRRFAIDGNTGGRQTLS
jgi:hypothetical protein